MIVIMKGETVQLHQNIWGELGRLAWNKRILCLFQKEELGRCDWKIKACKFNFTTSILLYHLWQGSWLIMMLTGHLE